MTDLFSKKEVTRPEDISNPYEHLVGDGKKYKDSAALAFAALKKDEHIDTIQRENAEAKAELERLRTELATRGTVEDALARLTKQPSNNVESNQDHERAQVNKETPDIQETVKSILDNERKAMRAKRNVDEADEALTKVWGKNYGDKLTEVANDLGASKEFLLQLAAENPKLFLRTVGASADTQVQRATTDNLPPTSRINTLSNTSSPIKGHKYYQNLRRSDPKAWQKNAARYESEMQAAVAQHGEAYFQN